MNPTPTTPTTKVCTACHRELPVDHLHFNRCRARAQTGFVARCKECIAARRPKRGDAWRGDGIAEMGIGGDLRGMQEARRRLAHMEPFVPPPRLAKIPGMVRLPCGTLVRENAGAGA